MFGKRGATAYGLTPTNPPIVFDLDNPGTLLAQIAVTGLAPGDSLVGIDFGPFDVQLYGVGQSGRLYIVNPISGLARVIGAGPWNALTGTEFAVDFLPGANRLRVMSDADINLTIDTLTGVVTTETPLTPGNPTIGGAAYAQFGINGPRLYVIDTMRWGRSPAGRRCAGSPCCPGM